METSMACSREVQSLPLFVSLVVVIFGFGSVVGPDSSSDSFVYGGCTQLRYSPGSAYVTNLNSLLTSLVNSATYSSFNKFTVVGPSSNDAVYGLYQCRGDLSMPECATCVARAVTESGITCSGTCGGTIQLQGCYVRYDNATFLGEEDKMVAYKKCGPSDGYQADVMGRRDSVLAGLIGATGPYRVGGSGELLGVAQCTGDLSAGQCQDCVYEAIKRLKSECATATTGDMFLVKCYARYSVFGSQMFTKSDKGKSGDKGTKTFAIIVGLLGGVALLIIFLSFIRRICQGPGGK
ncbi:hypothetical protein MLD38_033777 [Melastoma candidum]|uniref:Uncharacterized protein n=1 Tax=Melastoma candidum TaxID=119954 RepID=A0ACB9MBM9_9MYRT|nr:hypothetical protein MLD38_033777 [Melastoma candidum]